MKLERRFNDGSYYMFDFDKYHQAYENTIKDEYTIDEFTHPIYKNLKTIYFTSPWRKIRKFKYKNNICTVINRRIVYDNGYVIKLNYKYTNAKGNTIKTHKYIHKVNGYKFLKLLKLTDVEIIA
jgi:hypothetical protein